MRQRPTLAAAFTWVALATAAAGQQVFVVDDNHGPGVFTASIQTAVNAAASGDVVLVKEGFYSGPVTIAGKSLTLVGEAGATVSVGPGKLSITNLATSQSVVVRGIRVDSFNWVAIELKNDAGPVWIEDCVLRGGFVPMDFAVASPGVSAELCASVTIARSSVQGGAGATQFPDTGGVGLESFESTLWLFDSTFVGEAGESGIPFNFAGWGGAGAHATGGSLFASGCEFRGGDGGGFFGTQTSGGGGGTGLALDGVAASALECAFVGGSGGAGFVQPGPQGPPTSGSTLAPLVGVARHFASTSPVREGRTIDWTLGGVPGEIAAVFYAPAPTPGIPLLAFGGALLVDPAALDALVLGTIAGDGTLAVAIPAPALPAGAFGLPLFLQSIHFDVPTTYAAIGPVSALALLDASL
ncbi:MAG TPA: hypothetical protein VKE69_04955 [Planctomycetota bacterium]|nr:hypothetical protein [Planctomycetota bacterium]